MTLYHHSLSIKTWATHSTASLWAVRLELKLASKLHTIWRGNLWFNQKFAWVSAIKEEFSESETVCWCSMWPRLVFALCRSRTTLGHWHRATVTRHSAAERVRRREVEKADRWKRKAAGSRNRWQSRKEANGEATSQAEGLNICWWSAMQSLKQKGSVFCEARQRIQQCRSSWRRAWKHSLQVWYQTRLKDKTKKKIRMTKRADTVSMCICVRACVALFTRKTTFSGENA